MGRKAHKVHNGIYISKTLKGKEKALLWSTGFHMAPIKTVFDK
jgi:hypothetical protein